MSNIIRQYQPQDLAQLMAAWESASLVAHSFMDQAFFDQERHNIPNLYLPNADTWVVIENNLVRGFIALIGNEVGGLFVDAKFHGKGFGSALINKALQLHGGLTVQVFEQNTIGLGFYQKYGFKFISQSSWQDTKHVIHSLEYRGKP